MANLSLYSVTAFLLLDSDGNRVMSKYYPRPDTQSLTGTQEQPKSKQLANLKEQRAFERGLWEKTKKAGGDVILYDSYLALYKHSHDLIFYILGSSTENELMLASALTAFFEAINMLLRNQVEKRSVLENLDSVLIALDETIDDGIIIETDSTTIASRVTRPRPDTSEMLLDQQNFVAAVMTMKDRLQKEFNKF